LGLGGDPATHGEADQPRPIESFVLEPAVISREQPEVGPSSDALGGFLRRFREHRAKDRQRSPARPHRNIIAPVVR